MTVNGWASPLATETTPCPHVDAWDLFDPIETPDAVRVWIAFGLTVGACAVAGLGLGVLVASVIGKRIWDAVTAPT